MMIIFVLWYFVAVKASKVAKWILVVFFVLGVLGTVRSLEGTPMSILVFTLGYYLAQGIAVFFLFRPDSIAWFNGEITDISDVFE